MIKDYPEASAMALKCPLCHRKPVMGYDVGCSHASCSCGVKMAIPDGDPRTLLRLWNQFMLQDELTQATSNRLVNEHEQRTTARMARQ